MIKRTCQPQGFTLIEVLLGMALFTILVGTVVALQSLLAQSERFSLSTVYTIDNANASLQTLSQELRNARQSDNGGYPLEVADAQEIDFYSNADSDTEIEHIRYFLDGTDLKKGIIKPTGFPVAYPPQSEVVKTVASFIQNGANPLFFYYTKDWPTDQTNNPLPNPADISKVTLVKISVQINADPKHPEEKFTLEPFVQIRSLKTNQ